MPIVKRCIRCRQPMRNDGTEQQPQWVCNNPACVRYVPPAPEEEENEKEESNHES